MWGYSTALTLHQFLDQSLPDILHQLRATSGYADEPFVLFGYLAALTHLELLADVIILPQRQTMLVAKQAAEVDVLTGGKLRLDVEVGWIPVEYEALGMDYHPRGRVIEEQIEVLRLLWSLEVVSYQGRYYSITEAGLNPLPIRRSIPIWLGGWADAVLRRTARSADGWLPLGYPDDEMRRAIDPSAPLHQGSWPRSCSDM